MLLILPDDEGGGMLAVQHLLATGRTRIGHITGPEYFRAARPARRRGSASARRRRAVPGRRRDRSTANGARAGAAMRPAYCCAPHLSTDAVFCGSDQIARGVADALREMGSRLPDDIALVGFDNWTVMAEASQPPLTTIDMNLPEVGRVAAETLLSAIAGQPAHGTQVVPSRLVLRAST